MAIARGACRTGEVRRCSLHWTVCVSRCAAVTLSRPVIGAASTVVVRVPLAAAPQTHSTVHGVISHLTGRAGSALGGAGRMAKGMVKSGLRWIVRPRAAVG